MFGLDAFTKADIDAEKKAQCRDRTEAYARGVGDRVGEVQTFVSASGDVLTITLLHSDLQGVELTAPFLCFLRANGQLNAVSGGLRPSAERAYLKYFPNSNPSRN